LQPPPPKQESDIPEERVEESPDQGELPIQREQAAEPPIVETVPVPELVPVEPVRQEEPPIKEEVVQLPKTVHKKYHATCPQNQNLTTIGNGR